MQLKDLLCSLNLKATINSQHNKYTDCPASCSQNVEIIISPGSLSVLHNLHCFVLEPYYHIICVISYYCQMEDTEQCILKISPVHSGLDVKSFIVLSELDMFDNFAA